MSFSFIIGLLRVKALLSLLSFRPCNFAPFSATPKAMSNCFFARGTHGDGGGHCQSDLTRETFVSPLNWAKRSRLIHQSEGVGVMGSLESGGYNKNT